MWRNITMKELAKVLNEDLTYVDDIFLNQIEDPNLPITDMKLVLHAIRRSGRRMITIGKVFVSKKEI